MDTVLTHDIFPPKGFWEITWLGPVYYRRGRGQFSIDIVLRERAPNPFNKQELGKGYIGDPIVRPCGIGEIANLAVGLVAKDQKILSQILVERAQRKYDSDEKYTNVMRNKGDWEIIFDGGISPSASPPPDVGGFGATPCVVLYSRELERRIWVPHIELIRVIFAASAAFVKAIFHGTLCRPGCQEEAIFNVEKSHVDKNDSKRLFLFAMRKLRPQEAKVAALLYAHPELLRALKSVSDSFRLRGIGSGESIFTKVDWPPFEFDSMHGTVRKLFFGGAQNDSADQGNTERATMRRVMARVKGVSIPTPYDDVVVLYPVHGAKPGGHHIQRFHLKELSPSEIKIQNEIDPSLSHGGKVFVESPLLGESMDFLASMNVEYKAFMKKTGPVVVVLPQPDSERMVGSTANPGFGPDEVAVVDFVPPEDEFPVTNPQMCRRLLAVAEAIEIVANELGGTAYEVMRQGAMPIITPPRCVTFPVDWNGVDLPWSLYDDVFKWVRRAFVGLISAGGKIVYIIDAEIDRSGASPENEDVQEASTIFLFRPHTGVEMEYTQIEEMLAVLSKKRGVWPRGGFQHGTSERIVHSEDRLRSERLAEEIRKRLLTLGIC